MNYNNKFISIYLLNVILLESKILHLLSEIFQLRDKKNREILNCLISVTLKLIQKSEMRCITKLKYQAIK